MDPKKYVDSFLHNLKIVIKETNNLLPNDPVLYRVTKRINAVIHVDPLLVFNNVGTYLFKYKDFVYDKSTEDLLMEWDFIETEMSNPNNENKDIVQIIIYNLKICLKNMDNNGKEFFRALICQLLDDYLEYTFLINAT